MKDLKSLLKSQAMPIAAGFLIGMAGFEIVQGIWSNAIWPVFRIIDWDWTMKMTDRAHINCGGCLSTLAIGVLTMGLGVGLIYFISKGGDK